LTEPQSVGKRTFKHGSGDATERLFELWYANTGSVVNVRVFVKVILIVVGTLRNTVCRICTYSGDHYM